MLFFAFLCLAAASVQMENFESAINAASGDEHAAAAFMDTLSALMARPCGDPTGNLCKYQEAVAAGTLWSEIQAHASKRKQ